MLFKKLSLRAWVLVLLMFTFVGAKADKWFLHLVNNFSCPCKLKLSVKVKGTEIFHVGNGQQPYELAVGADQYHLICDDRVQDGVLRVAYAGKTEPKVYLAQLSLELADEKTQAQSVDHSIQIPPDRFIAWYVWSNSQGVSGTTVYSPQVFDKRFGPKQSSSGGELIQVLAYTLSHDNFSKRLEERLSD